MEKIIRKPSQNLSSLCFCLQLNQALSFTSQDIITTHDLHLFGPPFHEVDVTSLNRMIDGFSKAGDFISARRLFDGMPERDIVSWNSIMAAHARSEDHVEVVKKFTKMHGCSVKPNHTSFSTVLSSCGKLKSLNQGEQIHALSMKTCSSANVFVGTSLITMYSKCKVSDCLLRIFEDIGHPNIASWNAMISGLVLNRRIADARGFFDRMPSRNVVSWTAMIGGYIEVKNMKKALELFNVMPVKNSVSWAVMIGGLTSDGQFEEAVGVFTKMICTGVRADVSSLVKVIRACAGLGDPKRGRKIHGYVIKFGFHLEEAIEASLVSMYCDCLVIEEAKVEFNKMESKFIGSWNSLICGYINGNKVHDARILFDNMKVRDEISWNSMINGYLKKKKIDDAVDLFTQMPEPTLETITDLMSSFIEDGSLSEARRLFDMVPHGDVMAYTTMIYGYMKEGLLENAYELFKGMPERNVVTYNVMISGLLQHGKVKEAYNLFNETSERDTTSWNALVIGFVQNGLPIEAFLVYQKMMMSDICSSEIVLSSLLSASARLSSLIHGEQLHSVVTKLGHESCVVVGNSLISMYSKCGNVLKARLVFELIVEPDVVTWNVMIYGYAFNGLASNAIEMLENMKRTSIRPNDVTFLGILAACTHKRLLGEAQSYFNSMRTDYGIIPSLNHFACMVDLLCRMGMIEEAEKLVYSMPYKPDSVIWTSLLSGCRSNSNIKLAELAANQLFTWHPKDPMPYLHLISIYESAGRWDGMDYSRNQTNRMGSRRRPGYSWIETSTHAAGEM